jgi:hypothetical protein
MEVFSPGLFSPGLFALTLRLSRRSLLVGIGYRSFAAQPLIAVRVHGFHSNTFTSFANERHIFFQTKVIGFFQKKVIGPT